MKKLTPLALIAALALTGCVPKALEVTPGPSHVPAAAPVAAEDARQVWADDQITLFLNGNGAASFRGFTEGTPQREIQSWNSPTPGVLNVTIANGDWDEASLEHVGWDIMTKSGWETPELKLVRVATEDGKLSVDYSRADAPRMNLNLNANSAPPAR